MNGTQTTSAGKEASGGQAQKVDIKEEDNVKNTAATQYRKSLKDRPFPFMKLPGELRNMVYELALPRRSKELGMRGMSNSGMSRFYSLALVNRLISGEVSTLMYGTRPFPCAFYPGGTVIFVKEGCYRSSKKSMPSWLQVIPKIRRFNIYIHLCRTTCKAQLCSCMRIMSLFLQLLSDMKYHGTRDVHVELSWIHEKSYKSVDLDGAKELQRIYDALQSVRADKKIRGNCSFDVETKLREHFFKGELPEDVDY